ncbi:hypothetical protein L1987_14413 [Smallanthus sonchifolius]|uniref:Uncharacterized protein n=1 Tax=Smallanthus sonchifolius TaxID=185202 RepID=A0ACB9J3A1_9ASTR|nr:hypothetical protein L1987_14413 [Smallanthus sonchifolius]
MPNSIPQICCAIETHHLPAIIAQSEGIVNQEMENTTNAEKRKFPEENTEAVDTETKNEESASKKQRVVARTCVHEVAVPKGYTPSKDETIHGTLSDPVFNGKMAKTYPFVLCFMFGAKRIGSGVSTYLSWENCCCGVCNRYGF